MEEIKIRVAATVATRNAPPPLPGAIVQEFCLLQIRMICELIALGCLVAHGDITKANKLTKFYQADRIMHALEQLHPDFFPMPVVETMRGSSHHYLEMRNSGFLTKPEFIKLYSQTCGNGLHRGSLKNLLSAKQPRQFEPQRISELIAKIQGLLNSHVITLTGGETILVCHMQTKETGAVNVALAGRLSAQ